MQIAKTKAISVFVVGHITKDGQIAGPKVLEHIVDTVLQFEGDNSHSYRILRAAKNRFGSTNEIGIFEMSSAGLAEVKNPSEIFVSQRQLNSSGSTIISTIEGSRPILVEVQALVTHSSYGLPQRSSTGFDHRRLTILLAVIEKRLGIKLGQFDVITNIAGGVKISEPAADLGTVTSVISSYKDLTIDPSLVVIGEVGLSCEVRKVSFLEKRFQEISKLGFKKVIIPANNFKDTNNFSGVEIIPVKSIGDALQYVL
jgi:DNA repair protein RadA/Sms